MNQNKGIGAYKDRPGYFMGGMIGGAILGALVNKIQGKDWKRGALWGGITGGLGSWAGTALKPAAGTHASKLNFLQKMLYAAPNKAPGAYALRPALAKYGGLGLGAIAGGAGAYMMGDPEYDARKQEEAMLAENEERKRKNMELYGDWYKNFFPGFFNAKGGIINARPGYYNGGSATLDYTDPDLYTPTGEGGGPSSNPILQIPLGPEGSFTDEFEELDMGSLNPEIQKLYQAFLVANQATEEEVPIKMFMQLMQQQTGRSIGPAGASTVSEDGTRMMEMAAQGGYMGRPGYYGGGIGDMDLTQGGASFGPGTGTSDEIPAMLSNGEFVVTADAVSNLGGGDRMLGAKRMYRMMNQLDPNSQTPAEMSGIGYA